MGNLEHAMGYIRVAISDLLAADDPTGRSLELAGQALDIEEAFDEMNVEPTYIEPGIETKVALATAAALLQQSPSQVPLGVWGRLRRLIGQV